MAEIARGEWEQREGEGKVLSFRDQLATSWRLPEEGEKKMEQLKVEQDGSVPGHQVSQHFPERRHEQPRMDAERTLV